MTENYKIRLYTLTPIHIGSGDAYEPTQFVIDDNSVMHVFKTADFLASLDENKLEEFSSICREMTLIPVFRFFKKYFRENAFFTRKLKIPADLAFRYREILNLTGSRTNEVINKFELKRTIYNECNATPYIPGSSIKGSLKTAWMSLEAVKNSITNSRNIRDLETDLLHGKFDTDPFRFVKIPDLYPVSGTAPSRILYATNHKKRPVAAVPQRRGRGEMQVPFEVILPGAIFEGTGNLGEPHGFKRITERSRQALEKTISIESLGEATKEHYWAKLSAQESMLKGLGCSFQLAQKVLEKFGEKLFKTVFLLRLGHHSGAEFLTIDGNRNIKIMQGPGRPPKFEKESTTVWLASLTKEPQSKEGLVPFGWAAVEFEKNT